MADVKVKVTTIKDYHVTFDREEFLRMLNGRTNRFPYEVPANARVSIQVPGGSDYSNCRLDLDDVDGIVVEWTEAKVS